MVMAHVCGQALAGRQCLQPSFFRSRRPYTGGARTASTTRAATTVPAEFKTVAPVGDRVYVKVNSSEETSPGGILLPSSAQKKPTQGEIVAAGTAKAIKEGETVVYSKYAGTELTVSGNDYVILKEDDVIGLLSSDNIQDLKPLGDRVMVEVAAGEDRTEGGVLLTNSSKERPTLGKVVAVGSGRVDDKGVIVKPNLEVGDTVLYSKYTGTDFEGPEERQYTVIRFGDVLASLA